MFDVYYVELSATFREMSADDLEEMAINFVLPDKSIALELVPLQHGIPIEIKKGLRIPEIGAEVRGIKVSLGEIFQRTVSFTYLKPIITAFGLRENRFSWTLRDEAVRAGSHKFVAVIGVPKGSDSVILAMSAHVKTKKLFVLGGDLAGTELKFVKLEF